MRLQAHIFAVFEDRHEPLRAAVADFQAALTELEDRGGRDAEDTTAAPAQPRWGGDAQDTSPRIREYATPPLRLAWNIYVADLVSHLDREEALLPALAQGLLSKAVDAEVVTRKVTALRAEHEALRTSTTEARKVFLRVPPLLRIFSRVEAEFLAHVEAEDDGVFASVLLCAESGLDLEDTPTTGRYRVMDPTRAIRETLAQRPRDEEREEPGWLSWFKTTFSRKKRIKY